jgi:hypothetical protein
MMAAMRAGSTVGACRSIRFEYVSHLRPLAVLLVKSQGPRPRLIDGGAAVVEWRMC